MDCNSRIEGDFARLSPGSSSFFGHEVTATLLGAPNKVEVLLGAPSKVEVLLGAPSKVEALLGAPSKAEVLLGAPSKAEVFLGAPSKAEVHPYHSSIQTKRLRDLTCDPAVTGR